MFIHGFTAYGGPEVEHLLEVPYPSVRTGQVLIRTSAVGLNPADIKVRSGHRRESVPVVFPMAMGREAAGVVIAVGAGVDERHTGLSEGDEVFGATAAGTGALAEYVLLDAAATARRPSSVTAEQAATIPVALATAYDLLDQLALTRGDTLVVLGAGGGVGTAVCQLASHLGLFVVGVASEGKAEHVTSTGAHPVTAGAGWVARAATALQRHGSGSTAQVDGIVDLVGGPTLAEAAALAPPTTRLTSVADPAAAAALGGRGVVRRRTTAVFTRVAQLVETGALRPVITAHRGLERARDAVATIEHGHALGKVVVTLDES